MAVQTLPRSQAGREAASMRVNFGRGKSRLGVVSVSETEEW